MPENRLPTRTRRRTISLLLIGVGVLLLLSVPAVLVALAFADAQGTQLPGVLLILSATIGMALVAVGAAVR